GGFGRRGAGLAPWWGGGFGQRGAGLAAWWGGGFGHRGGGLAAWWGESPVWMAVIRVRCPVRERCPVRHGGAGCGGSRHLRRYGVGAEVGMAIEVALGFVAAVVLLG